MDDPKTPGPDETRVTSPAMDWVRKYIWWIGGIGGVVMITALRPCLINRPPPPPVVAHVPAEFALTDQDGRPFGPEQMRGEVYVVGFIFTRCPSLCPAITQAMLQFQRQLDEGGLQEEVKLLSVTIDPEYDTPEVLSAYAEGHGVDASTWRFVTAGTPEATEAFVVDGFKLGVGEREQVEPGVFDIAHSSKLALVDREGGIRGFYSIDPEGLEELYHRALAVVRIEDQ